MDIPKLKGIVSAIEDESFRPSPSHNNLARLVAMFFKELVSQYDVPTQETETVGSDTGVTVDITPVEEAKPKKKRKSK